MDKDFLNKCRLCRPCDCPPREVLRSIVIDADSADATGNETIFDMNGHPAGKVTSGPTAFT